MHHRLSNTIISAHETRFCDLVKEVAVTQTYQDFNNLQTEPHSFSVCRAKSYIGLENEDASYQTQQ